MLIYESVHGIEGRVETRSQSMMTCSQDQSLATDGKYRLRLTFTVECFLFGVIIVSPQSQLSFSSHGTWPYVDVSAGDTSPSVSLVILAGSYLSIFFSFLTLATVTVNEPMFRNV